MTLLSIGPIDENTSMIDIELSDQAITPEIIKSELEALTKQIPKDAIIRIACSNNSTFDFLTAQFLRDNIPPTLNTQLKGISKFVRRN